MRSPPCDSSHRWSAGRRHRPPRRRSADRPRPGGRGRASHAGADREIIHEAERAAEQNGAPSSTCTASTSSSRAAAVDDCQEAPSPILPATNEMIWGALSFARPVPAAGSSAARASRRAWRPAPSASAPTSTQAEAAKAEAEQRARPTYQAQLADAKQRGGPHHRGGPPDGRRDEARPAGAGRGRDRRDASDRPQPTSRRPRRRPSPTSAARSPRSPSVPPSRSSSTTSTARPTGRSSRATSTRSEPGGTDGGAGGRTDRVQAYAEALFDVAQAEGDWREVEDELFRFARALEGTDELREALTDPHIPATAAAADRRGPPRRQGPAGHHDLVACVVGTGRARELPGIIDRAGRAEPRAGPTRRWPRSARPSR